MGAGQVDQEAAAGDQRDHRHRGGGGGHHRQRGEPEQPRHHQETAAHAHQSRQQADRQADAEQRQAPCLVAGLAFHPGAAPHAPGRPEHQQAEGDDQHAFRDEAAEPLADGVARQAGQRQDQHRPPGHLALARARDGADQRRQGDRAEAHADGVAQRQVQAEQQGQGDQRAAGAGEAEQQAENGADAQGFEEQYIHRRSTVSAGEPAGGPVWPARAAGSKGSANRCARGFSRAAHAPGRAAGSGSGGRPRPPRAAAAAARRRSTPPAVRRTAAR